MGARLWRMVEEFRDSQSFRPSIRAVARQAGIKESTFANWQHVTGLPEAEHLRAFAAISRFSYQQLLDAALLDAGYIRDRSDGTATTEAGRAGDTNVRDLRVPAPPVDAAARNVGRKSRGERVRREQDEGGESP